MEKEFYRELTPQEEVEFKKWAHDNYVPGTIVQDVWHPVVKKTCNEMNRAARMPRVRVVVTGEGSVVLADFEVTPTMLSLQFPSVPVASTENDLSNAIPEVLNHTFDILDDTDWGTKELLDCPTCGGEGYIRVEPKVAIDCGTCDSKGKIPTNEGNGYASYEKAAKGA